jgi:MFS superfamily sulfate permease-like transporter
MNSNQPIKTLSFDYIKNDLPAGLVVFLVALPLCLGIALASGAPLFSGIISGIVGGTVVAFASGSSLSVSGPAAGLTVIVLNAITQLGGYDVFLLAVVLAGIVQIALGYLKAGIIGYYFPSSVIKGMLAAIGIILILKQIPHALGYDRDNEGDFYFLQIDGQNTFSELFNSVNYIQPGAFIISIVSLLILILWEQPMFRKNLFFKFIPGALIAVIIGVLLNHFFRIYHSSFALKGSELVQLPSVNSFRKFTEQVVLPDFTAFGNYQVYVVAITIAVIASLESLLSLEAVDKLDPYKRTSPVNRELKAQGLGNIISALLGGLPLTSVIVRSSANINAGGKSKVSAIFHGLLLLISVIGFASILNKIPLACLAAILLMVGYKLTKIALFKSMYKLGWEQFLPFIVTVLAIQFSDLLKGVAAGMAVAAYFILRNNYKSAFSIHIEKNNRIKKKTIIQLAEDVSFLNKGSIAIILSELPTNSHAVIDASKSKHIDIDVLEIIQHFKNNTAELKNITVELIHVPAFNETAAH